MNPRISKPKALFEMIKDLLSSKEVVTESYSDIANKTKNSYEQFMLAMNFKIESSSNDIMATFNNKSPEEQQEIIKLACNLRQQLLDMKYNDIEDKPKYADDVYNVLLWLAYYFPLNDVTANNKLICPLSNEVIDTQNRFVASNGLQYSKNYLLNNYSARSKLLPRDLEDLEWMRPVVTVTELNFRPRGENWDPLVGLVGILSGLGVFGGFAAAMVLGDILTNSFFTVLGFTMGGIFGGALIGAAAGLLLWTIGYGIVKLIVRLYDELNPTTHQRTEKLLFLEPTEPLVKKELKIKSQQLSQSQKTPSTPPAPTAPTASNSPAFTFFSDRPAFEPPIAQQVDPSLKAPLAHPVRTKIYPSRFLPPAKPPLNSDSSAPHTTKGLKIKK